MVGVLMEHQFRKVVQASKHFLHSPPAIAIEQTVFAQLEATLDCTLIRVKDAERTEYWHVPFDEFDKKKFAVSRGGFGAQWALTLDRWDVFDSEMNLIRARVKDPAPMSAQTYEEKKQQCDEALKGFKWQVGNADHISLSHDVGKLNKLYEFVETGRREKKREPSKRKIEDITRLQSSIIWRVEQIKNKNESNS